MVEEHRKKRVHGLRVKNRYSQRLLGVNGKKGPIDHHTERKRNEAHHGRLCFFTASSCGRENTEVQSQKIFCFTHGYLAPKSQQQRSWKVTIGMKHRNVDLFPQSMRVASDETIGARTGIRGHGGPQNVRSKSKRATTSSVLAGVESFGGLSFARTSAPATLSNHSRLFPDIRRRPSIGQPGISAFPLQSSFCRFYQVRAAFHFCALFVIQTHPRNVFCRVT